MLDVAPERLDGPRVREVDAALLAALREGLFKSWGYSGSHALELLEKSSDILWDRLC